MNVVREEMHSAGLCMRHLPHVRSFCTIAPVRMLLLTEMAQRAIWNDIGVKLRDEMLRLKVDRWSVAPKCAF